MGQYGSPCHEIFQPAVAILLKYLNGNPFYAHGVLDSWSQVNFVLGAQAEKLEFKRNKNSIDIRSIDKRTFHIRSKALIKVSTRFGGFEYLLVVHEFFPLRTVAITVLVLANTLHKMLQDALRHTCHKEISCGSFGFCGTWGSSITGRRHAALVGVFASQR